MKKQLLSVLCFILGVLLGVSACMLFITLKDANDKKDAPAVPTIYLHSDDGYTYSDIVELAYTAASYIRSGDYDSLSAIVHPEFGLIISPYSTINLSSNQCLTAPRVKNIPNDETVYVWGTKPDTGEPVQLTAMQYFSNFVYNRDYAYAPVVGVNKEVKTGNALENVSTIFTDGEFVDFCYPGTSADGLDWSILRLVFEPYEDSLRLSAIIHSEYTN